MDKKKFSLIDFFAENKLIHTLLAIVCGFIVGALFMMAMDVSVSVAYGKLFSSIFGGIKFMSYCVVYATPYIVTGLSAIVSIIMLFIIAINHVGIQGDIAAKQAKYESLIWQYENDIYDNDNDIGRKELMTEIQEWNSDVARGKTNQRDFWVGIFTPNIYDQFELIEYKEVTFDEP